MSSNKPAIFGGTPIFNNLIPLARPTLPAAFSLMPQIEDAFNTGQLSSYGPYSKALENKFQKYVNVEHALAVTNGTTGLFLVLKALGLKGKVIVPSFAFPVSVHALTWCGLKPVFADIDPLTYNIDCQSIENLIDEDTSAILCLNCFGVPCDIDRLTQIASKNGLALIFDSAHACGSQYKNKPLGQFGDAEVFSTSATKVFTTGEGGFITTRFKDLADHIKIIRNYGIANVADDFSIGLNGKMGELAAILGLQTIDNIDVNVEFRNKLAKLYCNALQSIEGVHFQHVPVDCMSAYKDFAVVIDREQFGMSRDLLALALEKENIQVKSYFNPPMHRHPLYRDGVEKSLSSLANTNFISENILSLPMYSHLESDTVLHVAEAINRIHKYSAEIAQSEMK